MRNIILQLIITAAAFMSTAYFMPGFKVKDFGAALIASVVIAFVGAFIRPLLVLLTLPITVLTLGLFLFVVNGIVIKICAYLVPGFEVSSWTAAILGALLLSIINGIFHWLVGL